MADINLNQVIHNVKEAYLTVSGDTPSSVKYGNIDTKVGTLVKPTGDLEITENGEYDVTAYETATVNVAGGGEQALGAKARINNTLQSIAFAIPTTTTISIQ